MSSITQQAGEVAPVIVPVLQMGKLRLPLTLLQLEVQRGSPGTNWTPVVCWALWLCLAKPALSECPVVP